MPVSPTYPGVYIEELPSPVHTIIGVPTNVAAFVGPAPRGPTHEARTITSFQDYVTFFGGESADSRMSRAIWFFFQNGGQRAEVVRVAGDGADPSTIALGDLTLTATSPGTWGNFLRARVDQAGTRPVKQQEQDSGGGVYNLTVRDMKAKRQEVFQNVSTLADSPQSLAKLLAASNLVTVVGAPPDTLPHVHDPVPPGRDEWSDDYSTKADGGTDAVPQADDYVRESAGTGPSGIYALRHVDIFNMLCVPDLPAELLDACLELCVERRAMLIVDPPDEWTTVAGAQHGMTDSPPVHGRVENAAIYFPRITAPDSLQDGNPAQFEPSGAIAGIWAGTDVARGVWKAPAGTTDGRLSGVTDTSVLITDQDNGLLNPVGVNCLRKFPIYGPLVWGARTMAGADETASQWKYIPVRRMALFLEETLFRTTKWVCFEPNDEPLWSSIRLNIETFMHGLFRQGAFQGATPRDAYLVQCDAKNNPQEDIDRGIVNILVGFAPLKPAEFVVIQIQQQSQLQTG